MRHQPAGTRRNGGPDEVPRSFATDAGGANDRCSHLTWIKILREVGELMDHDVRACRCDHAGQRRRVEDVDHDRVRPERAQRVGIRFDLVLPQT